jgi:hypothetical protein
MNFKNKTIIFISIILTTVFFYSFIMKGNREGYSNNNLELLPGTYPESTVYPIIIDEYPFTGRNSVSNNSVEDIWWHYPIFRVGSYEQITNNLKYPNNPDDGKCSRSEFCGALYKDNQIASNISKPLPPAPPVTAESVRIGYYSTPLNLFLGNQLGPELPVF